MNCTEIFLKMCVFLTVYLPNHYTPCEKNTELVHYFRPVTNLWPVLLDVRSKASVCGRSLAGIAGSNPIRGMDVCLLLCVVT